MIARVNDPRNQTHFDLLGITPTVCPTQRIMALIEHEVPEHDLVHLLELRKENLEIIEVEIDRECPCVGKPVEDLGLPGGLAPDLGAARRRGGDRRRRDGLKEGDQVLAILEPGKETEVRKILSTLCPASASRCTTARGFRLFPVRHDGPCHRRPGAVLNATGRSGCFHPQPPPRRSSPTLPGQRRPAPTRL